MPMRTQFLTGVVIPTLSAKLRTLLREAQKGSFAIMFLASIKFALGCEATGTLVAPLSMNTRSS